MELFKITFALCHYLGLHAFRYRKNQFKITKLGITLMFANATVFLVLYAWENRAQKEKNVLVADKWAKFLPYWHFSQLFVILYCLIGTSVKSNVNFSNYCLEICKPINADYKMRGFVAWYFVLMGALNVVSYLWFNMVIWRSFGTPITFIITFGVLHTDIILVAFEAFVLFLLNAVKETLHGVELRLMFVHSVSSSSPPPSVPGSDQLFKMAKRPTIRQRREIRNLRIIHYECTTLVEKLMNKYKFILLYVVGRNYVVTVSYLYFASHTLYLYLSKKRSENIVLMCNAVFYLVTKMIRLWTLCDIDSQLNQQIKNIQLILHKLTFPFQFSDTTKEIRIFQYQCFVKPIKLTVGGLFHLDTNFLQSSIAAALAYVVLMLQYTDDIVLPEDHSPSTTSSEDLTFTTSSLP